MYRYIIIFGILLINTTVELSASLSQLFTPTVWAKIERCHTNGLLFSTEQFEAITLSENDAKLHALVFSSQSARNTWDTTEPDIDALKSFEAALDAFIPIVPHETQRELLSAQLKAQSKVTSTVPIDAIKARDLTDDQKAIIQENFNARADILSFIDNPENSPDLRRDLAIIWFLLSGKVYDFEE